MAEPLQDEPGMAGDPGAGPMPNVGDPGEGDPNAQDVSLFEVLQEQIKYQAQTHPYATVAAAAALGYVLGGGVPWWAVRAATSIGSRMLVARVVAAVVDEQ